MRFGNLWGCPLKPSLFFLIILMLEVGVHCCFVIAVVNMPIFGNNFIVAISETKFLRDFDVYINSVSKVSINAINNVIGIVEE